MPHISKRKLDKKVEEELFDALGYILSHSSPTDLRKILPALMTDTERLMIAKRIGIAVLLQSGIADTTIDDLLKVTRFTIQKMELLIGAHQEEFALILKIVAKKHGDTQLKNILLELAHYLGSASGGRLPGKLPAGVQYTDILNTKK